MQSENKIIFAYNSKSSERDYEHINVRDVEEALSVKDLKYEVIIGDCVPYYDIDIPISENNADFIDSMLEDKYLQIKDLFPNGKIYCFVSRPLIATKTKKKNGEDIIITYISAHFLVRGVGYYKSGLDVPKIDSDTSVYKGRGKQQKFRMPYRNKDEQERIFVPFEFKNKSISYIEEEKKIKLEYLVSYIEEEKEIFVNKESEVYDFCDNKEYTDRKTLEETLNKLNPKEFQEPYSKWFSLMSACYNSLENKMFALSIFDEFCSKMENYDQDEIIKKWGTLKWNRQNKNGFGSIVFLAKKNDEIVYGNRMDKKYFYTLKTLEQKIEYINHYNAYIEASNQFAVIKYSKNIPVEISLLNRSDFIIRYENLGKIALSCEDREKLTDSSSKIIKSSKKKVINVWLEHPDRREFDNISMGIEKPNHLTYYPQIGTPPNDEEVNMNLIRPFLDHLFHITANGNRIHYDYILNWYAHVVKFPYKNIQKALVLYSKKQGSGKGTIDEKLMSKIFGERYCRVQSLAQIENFNGVLENKTFVLLDEVEKSGIGYKLADLLKGMITGEDILINGKYVKIKIVRSSMNFVFNTNNLYIIKVEPSDRRYAIFEVSNERVGDTLYFNDMVDLINNKKAVQHFVNYLTSLKCEDFNFNNIPMTDIKKMMTVEDPVDLFLKSNLSNFGIDTTSEEKTNFYLGSSKELFGAFVRFCTENNFNKPKENTRSFGRMLITRFKHVKCGKNIKKYLIPVKDEEL